MCNIEEYQTPDRLIAELKPSPPDDPPLMLVVAGLHGRPRRLFDDFRIAGQALERVEAPRMSIGPARLHGDSTNRAITERGTGRRLHRHCIDEIRGTPFDPDQCRARSLCSLGKRDDFSDLRQSAGRKATETMKMWQTIATAPFDRDLELAVIDADGAHTLVFPCRRILNGWMNAETKERLDVHPTHWRVWARTDGEA